MASARLHGLSIAGDPSPLSASGRAPSVLCVHGFGGTPQEVRLPFEVAQELGLRAHAPLLPGHGVSAEELATTRFGDWLGGAEAAFAGLPKDPVILCGLSLGSLLSIELCLAYPERVRGLVLMANALWLVAPFPAWPLAAMGPLRLPDFMLPKVTSDIADPEARRTHLTLTAQPVHAAADVWRAGRRLRAQLGSIRCPVLVLHGARDRVCPAKNAERARARLGSDDVRVRVFPRSRHILTRDVERALVREELLAFLRRLSQDGA